MKKQTTLIVSASAALVVLAGGTGLWLAHSVDSSPGAAAEQTTSSQPSRLVPSLVPPNADAQPGYEVRLPLEDFADGSRTVDAAADGPEVLDTIGGTEGTDGAAGSGNSSNTLPTPTPAVTQTPEGQPEAGNPATVEPDTETSVPDTDLDANSPLADSSCEADVDAGLSEMILGLPAPDQLLGLHYAMAGYWADEDNFIGFTLDADGVTPVIRYGIIHPSFHFVRQAFYIDSQADTAAEYRIFTQVPAIPAIATYSARPESTLTISINICNWADGRLNVKFDGMEGVGGGMWLTYDFGGLALEEHVNRLYGE